MLSNKQTLHKAGTFQVPVVGHSLLEYNSCTTPLLLSQTSQSNPRIKKFFLALVASLFATYIIGHANDVFDRQDHDLLLFGGAGKCVVLLWPAALS